MKKHLRAALKLVVIFVVVPVIALIMLWRNRCVESPIDKVLSPDGAFAAELVRIDCGPSMRVATALSLHTQGASKQSQRLVLMQADGGVTVEWKGPLELVISRPADSVVAKHVKSWEGVAITMPQPSPE